MYQSNTHTQVHTSQTPCEPLCLDLQTVTSIYLSFMLFQPSRLIQGHEHQGSLFELCASMCASVYVCLFVCLSACVHMHVNVLTANKSVSSLRHYDPEHALLPVSLRLASSLERAEDSSKNAPLSLRNSLISILQFSAREPVQSLQ